MSISAGRDAQPPIGGPVSCAAGVFGVAATLVGAWSLIPIQFNVVRYDATVVGPRTYHGAEGFALALLLLLFGGAWWAVRPATLRRRANRVLERLAPLALNVPLAALSLAGWSPTFTLSLVWVAAMSWSAWRVVEGVWIADSTRHAPGRNDTLWVVILLLGVIVATVVHTGLQRVFFEHFLLGHADFGHYLEELKNALAGRGLRCDSFPNTRLGWHFSPSLYVMAPLYRVWPSPTLLMVCSAFLIHVGAVPIYFIVRRHTGSAMAAFLMGIAWLFHPSMSRMVYSSTYGFQWVYVAIPLTVCAFGAIWASRWWTFAMLVCAILLVQETTAAAVFGIGLSMVLFAPTRWKGALVCGLAAGYFILCVEWLIPGFAASGRYERGDLFGSLGASFGELAVTAWRNPLAILNRWARPEGWYLVALLLGTLAFRPLRQWRVAIAAVPSLVLVFLLENRDWLSIKFWHQATALPILFCAAVKSLDRAGGLKSSDSAAPASDHRSESPTPEVARSGSRRAVAVAAAVAYACAWSHYFYGFSPVAKSFEVFRADAALQAPDPRLAIAEKLRADFSRGGMMLATERLAAHFTDFKRLYTGKRMRETDYVVLDRSDRWDSTGLPGRADGFRRDPNYRVYLESGPMIVFVRSPDAPVIPVEE